MNAKSSLRLGVAAAVITFLTCLGGTVMLPLLAAAAVSVQCNSQPSPAEPGDGLTACRPRNSGLLPAGPQGWLWPVDAPIVSPYGVRDGRLHAGIDLAAARFTPIRSASAGIVIQVRCQSSTGTCDRDGGVDARGCGWFVDVFTVTDLTFYGWRVSNVVTRYCHMVARPMVNLGQTVAAGQGLGLVGSSGRSSGPHLHFEVHLNTVGGRADQRNAVDPQDFFRSSR